MILENLTLSFFLMRSNVAESLVKREILTEIFDVAEDSSHIRLDYLFKGRLGVNLVSICIFIRHADVTL